MKEAGSLRKLTRYQRNVYAANGSVYDKSAANAAVAFINCLRHAKGEWHGAPYLWKGVPGMSNIYCLSSDSMHYIGQFRSGGEFFIDCSDYPWASQFMWFKGKRGYAVTNIKRKPYYMHRLLMDAARDQDVDHISGDKLDNRRANLRVCTHQQNSFNQRIRNTNSSGYAGVSYSKNARCYEAYINRSGKKYHLGLFQSAHEAALARDRAAIRLYGEFARLNFGGDHEKTGACARENLHAAILTI